MKHAFPLAAALALATSGGAFADDHCRSPMADWQPREGAIAHVQQLGITAERLKIDDGCYEIKGRDAEGNKIEMKLDPASLAVMTLEIEFRHGADPSRYLPGARGLAGTAPAANPLLTPGTAPQVSGN